MGQVFILNCSGTWHSAASRSVKQPCEAIMHSQVNAISCRASRKVQDENALDLHVDAGS